MVSGLGTKGFVIVLEAISKNFPRYTFKKYITLVFIKSPFISYSYVLNIGFIQFMIFVLEVKDLFYG